MPAAARIGSGFCQAHYLFCATTSARAFLVDSAMLPFQEALPPGISPARQTPQAQVQRCMKVRMDMATPRIETAIQPAPPRHHHHHPCTSPSPLHTIARL